MARDVILDEYNSEETGKWGHGIYPFYPDFYNSAVILLKETSFLP